MTLSVGVIGVSDGNGHPFSFSAILNGYDDEGMAASGWPVIHAYLRRREASEFGGLGMRVTHAWTQDPATTDRLRRACRIPHAVLRPEELVGAVDAVIVARDDPASHLRLALPFLEAGMSVFVDKPLTLERGELEAFGPFLDAGRLMSCSGMRFACELDEARADLAAYGELRLLRGAVVNDFIRYGVHLLDAVLGLVPARPVRLRALPARHEALAIELDDGSLFHLDALGTVPSVFRLDLFGERRASTHELRDNFGMFRRTLAAFAQAVRTGRPAIPPDDVRVSMATLRAGRRALVVGGTVDVGAV